MDIQIVLQRWYDELHVAGQSFIPYRRNSQYKHCYRSLTSKRPGPRNTYLFIARLHNEYSLKLNIHSTNAGQPTESIDADIGLASVYLCVPFNVFFIQLNIRIKVLNFIPKEWTYSSQIGLHLTSCLCIVMFSLYIVTDDIRAYSYIYLSQIITFAFIQ